MKNRKLSLLIWLGVTLLVVTACNFYAAASTPEPGSSAAYTQAAQTMAALLTQQAYNGMAATLTSAASGGASTPTATQPGAIPPTAAPPATATVTPTPRPPTATPVLALCDQAQFVKDVTVDDGSIMPPGAEFTKVWRLKNIGTCTWNRNYSLVFVDGERMSASRSVPLGETVRPGERIDVHVDFVAPTRAGRYKSEWMLSNDNEEAFGLGEDADQPFWAQIRVNQPNENFALDMATNMCLASWRSSAGNLPCPGDSESEDGSVILLDRPVLENGRREDESTLWMRPEVASDGWITGTYPEYKVRAGDHFIADIGCLDGNSGCDVNFSLDYLLSNGSLNNLGRWEQTFDGSIQRVDVDLSSLEDQKIRLVLSVANIGKAAKANVFWLAPSVRKGPPKPPPVETPQAVQAARQRVASDLAIDVSAVSVESYEAAQWTDSCLGVHLQDQICAEVLIPGYRVILSTGSARYEAHTNQDGKIVFWFEL